MSQAQFPFLKMFQKIPTSRVFLRLNGANIGRNIANCEVFYNTFCSVDFFGLFLAFVLAPAWAPGFLPTCMLPQLPGGISEPPHLPSADVALTFFEVYWLRDWDKAAAETGDG